MKKLIAMILAAMLLLVSVNAMAIANPVTECASLEEVNEIAGTNLQRPGVMGVKDVDYLVIDCGDYIMGQYDFEVNGLPCMLRNANVTNKIDISGFYDGEGTAFGVVYENPQYYYADEFKFAHWDSIDGQFVFCVNDNGTMNKKDFLTLAEEMMIVTSTGMLEVQLKKAMADLVGEYWDETSQRATAKVESIEDGDALRIVVDWSSSASESSQWVMTARMSEDGMLYYSDCAQNDYVYDEQGNETVTEISKDGEGYFVVIDGKLAWEGAADEGCRSCVFTKN